MSVPDGRGRSPWRSTEIDRHSPARERGGPVSFERSCRSRSGAASSIVEATGRDPPSARARRGSDGHVEGPAVAALQRCASPSVEIGRDRNRPSRLFGGALDVAVRPEAREDRLLAIDLGERHLRERPERLEFSPQSSSWRIVPSPADLRGCSSRRPGRPGRRDRRARRLRAHGDATGGSSVSFLLVVVIRDAGVVRARAAEHGPERGDHERSEARLEEEEPGDLRVREDG